MIVVVDGVFLRLCGLLVRHRLCICPLRCVHGCLGLRVRIGIAWTRMCSLRIDLDWVGRDKPGFWVCCCCEMLRFHVMLVPFCH